MVIDNLEKGGMVRRERDPEDRRSYNIHLTDTGRKMIVSLVPDHAVRIAREMKVCPKASRKFSATFAASSEESGKLETTEGAKEGRSSCTKK